MRTIARCGFLFFVLIVGAVSARAEEVSSYALDPLIISKRRVHLLPAQSLSGDDLQERETSSLLQSLSFLSLDMQSRSLGGGIQSDVSLRGSTFQGVLFLLNGKRINDPQTAHHNADIPFTTEDIRKIEVTPGVSSALFGPDSIGGAIHFMIKKPQERIRVAKIGMGDYQTAGALVSIEDKFNNLGIRVSVENKESGGFTTDTDFKKFTSSVSSSLDIPDGEYTLNFGYQEKEFGAYDFYTPHSGYLSKEWTKTYLLDTALSLERNDLLIKPSFLWRRHFDKFALDKTQIRSRYLNHHQSDIYTPSFYLQKEIPVLGRLGAGTEYGEEKINSTNLGKYSRTHTSFFLDDSGELTPEISYGFSLRTDDYDSFGRDFTGSASVKYRFFEPHALYAGLARSTRVPSFTELYYNDPTTLGDMNLGAEKAWNYQMGYEYDQEDVGYVLTAFVRQESDTIDWIKRTSRQSKWQVENITDAEVFGIEQTLRLQMRENLMLDANYTFINKRINDQGFLYKYGPNYIRHLLNSNLVINLPFGEQSIGFTYKKKPVRDGWFLMHAALSYNLNRHSRLFLKAENLMNVEYQEIEGIAQPGRWVEAGIRVAW
ncbi:MAG: TonB-dependent receptor [Candidatus Omnitrophica bacterium]|nr:TonB-dependent receptor [Candidatus Omnitrophota bacterium]